MPYTDFHYTPTGTGVISGKEVLEQTEDAINDLGTQISGDVETAIQTANNALNVANTASDDAQNAVNTANTAYTAATNAQNTANAAQNTASNALTAAQNAQNDVNALGNRVTTAENNISQNTSDISGLTTRMGTAENNITTLQNDVVTAQGTATSAQITANLAREQSYVLRYASSTVTPNSTIAYTVLNNTDNVKMGDSLIDASGQVFLIVSVDSVNETVTVGAVLLTLALDANVMHLSGNETAAGNKTFTDTVTFSSVNIEDIRWKSLVNQTIDLNDCYVAKAGAMSGYYTTDISSGANISNKAANTAFTMLSLTTRRVSASDYQVRQIFYGSGVKYIRTCANGTWTAWVNETDKYVTTDTNQNISGEKTFNDLQVIGYGTQYKGARNAYILPEFAAGYSGLSITSLSFAQTVKIGNFVLDANNKPSLDTTKGYVQFATGENNGVNTCILEPRNSAASSLGTSSNKWNEINGLTPSSLSFPATSGTLDISGYVTDLTGVNINNYTPVANGYIVITCYSNEKLGKRYGF